jgi:formyl-CoA transferase/CoA:oxalate CoA-transferase
MALTREQEGIGEYTIPGRALRFSRTPGETGDVPTLGEDTDDILAALGFSAAAVADLRERDVVR